MAQPPPGLLAEDAAAASAAVFLVGRGTVPVWSRAKESASRKRSAAPASSRRCPADTGPGAVNKYARAGSALIMALRQAAARRIVR